MQHLKNIKVFTEDLLPGLFVSRLDCAWSESNFLLQGFKIESTSDIESLQHQCKFVYIDFISDEQYSFFKLETTKSTSYKQELTKKHSKDGQAFRKKIQPALVRGRKTNRLMKSLLDNIMLGQDFDLVAVRDTVKENVKQVLENTEAMLMLTMLKSQSEDIAQHSLNVSIMSIAFAHELGYSETELEDIGMAALLHDIGLAKVDSTIVNKHGKLNQVQKEKVQKHCQYGFDILSGKAGLTPSCVDVAISHHEELSGGGYPRGIKEIGITKNVRIVSIIDVYDTLTNYQIYSKVSSVLEGYKELMKEKKIRFDESLLLKFIKWRSIYPPGTIVELQSGEVGIVLSSKINNRMKPKLMLVLDEYKQPISEKIIDLSKLVVDNQSNQYKIVNSYENTAFGIDIQIYLDNGLVISS